MSKPLSNEEIDARLDGIQREREQVLAQPLTAGRYMRLADLAELEASWWEALGEHSLIRVYWRAALAARQHALDTARRWRARADALQFAESQSTPLPESEAA